MTSWIKSIFYNRFFIFVCIIACIFSSGYAISTIYPIGIFIDIIFSIIFIFPIIRFLIKSKINMLVISFILLNIMLIANFITTGISSPVVYLSIISKIIFAYGIVIVYKFDDFVTLFLKIMVVISIISLFGYYLTNYSQVLRILPVMTSVNNVSYAIGYIYFYITFIPSRNCGIFWEPGIFASFLIIAIIFEYKFKEFKPSFIKILLFIVTILTTKSSAGYGLLLFLVFFILFNKLNIKMNKLLLSSFLIILLSIFILVTLNYTFIITKTGLINFDVIRRLTFENLKEEARFLSVIHNFQMFLKTPFFGWGFKVAYENIKYVADISTSTFLLNVFGILGIQYTLYWIYGILKIKNSFLLLNLVIAVIFLLIINKESHISFVFSWCILFYFIKNSLKQPHLLFGKI